MSAPERPRTAVIGAGFAGLGAAHELARAGHRVVVYEAAPQPGGLASGFREPGWDWPVERFYHHFFTSDRELIALAGRVGIGDDGMLLQRALTATWCETHGEHPFDSPAAVLRFPHLPLRDRVRVGAALAWLRTRRDWRRLERVSAESWLRGAMGERAYELLWRPLLIGKFGALAPEVNMAWFWARIVSRTRRLGYFRGGFQTLADRIAADVRAHGGELRFGAAVRRIRRAARGADALRSADTGPGARPASDVNSVPGPSPGAGAALDAAGAWLVESATEGRGEQGDRFDAVVVTTSPALLARFVPDLPPSYLAGLAGLRSLGAVVVALALSRPLLRGTYWLNLPAGRFPLLSLVEHTNLVPARHYGGHHLVYLGNYLPAGHEFFSLGLDDLLARMLPAVARIVPGFDPAAVRNAWVSREIYAQPVVAVGHGARVPPLATPLPGLYWASMSQVYPWDRGTNFAVEIGRRAAAAVIAAARPGSAIAAAADEVVEDRGPRRGVDLDGGAL